jgi:hypothetical protein
MVVYQLCCEHEHSFEAWFAGSDAYDAQVQRGLVSCPQCGSTAVRKLPAGIHFSTQSTTAPSPSKAPVESTSPAIDTGNRAAMLQAFRAFVQSNTENVGHDFANQARQMHYGDIEHRNIRGKVSQADAVSLHEEGVHTMMVPPDVRFDEDLQ